MTAGRKPKPSGLRLIDGNAGHRPQNTEEPQPKGELGPPHHDLTEVQKEIWREQAAAVGPGHLTSADRSVFRRWVIAESRGRDAASKVNDTGMLIKGPNGGWQYNPFEALERKWAKEVARLDSELGFTPSSRSRVKVSKKPSASNPFAGLKDLD